MFANDPALVQEMNNAAQYIRKYRPNVQFRKEIINRCKTATYPDSQAQLIEEVTNGWRTCRHMIQTDGSLRYVSPLLKDDNTPEPKGILVDYDDCGHMVIKCEVCGEFYSDTDFPGHECLDRENAS